jgi:ATP-dependent Clp protease ATP-binding subunit ClpA
MVDALKSLFRPEFLNRVDEIIPFNSLTENELVQIIDLLLDQTNEALKSKEIKLEVDEPAKKFLLSKGTDLKYGARPLRRTIQNYIEDILADKILRNELKSGNTVFVHLSKNGTELEFKIG